MTAAIGAGVGAVINFADKAFNALANRIEKAPKDSFKLIGYSLNWLSYIDEKALEALGGIGNYFKAAEGVSSLFYPIDAFVSANKLRHMFKTNPVTHKLITSLNEIGMTALSITISSCDTARLFHKFSVWNLDRALPFFANFSLKQFLGVTGSTSLALLSTMRSYQSYKKIEKIREEIGTTPHDTSLNGLENVDADLKNAKTKMICKLIGQIALIALGILLIKVAATGVPFIPFTLICASTSLFFNFVVQFFEDPEPPQITQFLKKCLNKKEQNKGKSSYSTHEALIRVLS